MDKKQPSGPAVDCCPARTAYEAAGAGLLVGVAVQEKTKAVIQHAGPHLICFGGHRAFAPSPQQMRAVESSIKASGSLIGFP